MRVGLMIPCYIDVFHPEVAIATLELLEKLGVEAEYPFDQTCCGQPMANAGCESDAKAAEELLVRNFSKFDHIVIPSGSCANHVRNKLTSASASPEREHVRGSVRDLAEFLHDVLAAVEFPWAEFPHRVAVHTGCSAIRGLHEESMSERVHDAPFSKPKSLLQKVKGIEIADFERADECCGFGGTFAVSEEAVSVKMGVDKLGFVAATRAEYIVSTDMSCLMHLQGCARSLGRDVKFLHLAQVLNGIRE